MAADRGCLLPVLFGLAPYSTPLGCFMPGTGLACFCDVLHRVRHKAVVWHLLHDWMSETGWCGRGSVETGQWMRLESWPSCFLLANIYCVFIMDQILGCENEFSNSWSRKGADMCNDIWYDRDIYVRYMNMIWYLYMIETYVVFVGGQERESPWGVRKGLLRKGLNLVSSVWGSHLTSLGLSVLSYCVGRLNHPSWRWGWSEVK